MQYFIERFFLFSSLALFTYIKPPSFSYMQTMVPNHIIWTDGLGGPKQKYLATVDKLHKSTEFLYVLQKTLLMALMDNTDGNETSPSSRKVFLSKLRRYVMDLSVEQRVNAHIFALFDIPN